MNFVLLRRPYRFFLIAAALALLLCLFPMHASDSGEPPSMESDAPQTAQNAQSIPADADLSRQTTPDTMLHVTLTYAPCGHSVQRREKLCAALCGLTRTALEAEIGGVYPGAVVTGFAAQEVDASMRLDLPCPMHWVLRGGEDGMLHILQNRTGEALSLVRVTDVPLHSVSQGEQAALLDGRIFDDVQALEGYLESISS